MASFEEWLEEQTGGDYSQDRLKKLQAKVKSKHQKEKNASRKNQLNTIAVAMDCLVKDHFFPIDDTLEKIDPSKLV